MGNRGDAAKRRKRYGWRLVRESDAGVEVSSADRLPCRSPRDAYTIMAPFAAQEGQEVFWMLCLDSQHRVTRDGVVVITRGILNSSLVHPREVFREAVLRESAAVILCHNHPSGDPTPSPEDRLITEQLAAAGRVLDIPVFDHVVIGAGCYTSFAEQGLL
jgi:DNA repair protein RadC